MRLDAGKVKPGTCTEPSSTNVGRPPGHRAAMLDCCARTAVAPPIAARAVSPAAKIIRRIAFPPKCVGLVLGLGWRVRSQRLFYSEHFIAFEIKRFHHI